MIEAVVIVGIEVIDIEVVIGIVVAEGRVTGAAAEAIGRENESDLDRKSIRHPAAIDGEREMNQRNLKDWVFIP